MLALLGQRNVLLSPLMTLICTVLLLLAARKLYVGHVVHREYHGTRSGQLTKLVSQHSLHVRTYKQAGNWLATNVIIRSGLFAVELLRQPNAWYTHCIQWCRRRLPIEKFWFRRRGSALKSATASTRGAWGKGHAASCVSPVPGRSSIRRVRWDGDWPDGLVVVYKY